MQQFKSFGPFEHQENIDMSELSEIYHIGLQNSIDDQTESTIIYFSDSEPISILLNNKNQQWEIYSDDLKLINFTTVQLAEGYIFYIQYNK